MVTTAKGESRDRACTGMTEPQQLVLEEHSLSASRRSAPSRMSSRLERGLKKRPALVKGRAFYSDLEYCSKNDRFDLKIYIKKAKFALFRRFCKFFERFVKK